MLLIPAAVAEEVITQAEAVIHTENQVRTAILQGMLPLDAARVFGRF